MSILLRLVAFAFLAAVIVGAVFLFRRTEKEDTQPQGTFRVRLEADNGMQLSTQLQSAMRNVKKILENVIAESPLNGDTLVIKVNESNLGATTLGYASGSTIHMNSTQKNKTIGLNNDINKSAYTVILLHEALHVLGLVCVASSALQYCDFASNKYTGPAGVRQLQALQKSCNLSTLKYVWLEDSGGAGTERYHFEESASKCGVFPELIMSGYLSTSMNYLSNIELGLLEDIGFVVNYKSSYVASNSTVCNGSSYKLDC